MTYHSQNIYTRNDRVYKMIRGVLSVRIDKELEEKLDYLMKKRHVVDKSAYVRQLLNKSIASELLDYVCNEISLEK